jgi:hypothetical protein
MGLLAFFFGFIFVYSGQSFWQTVKKWKWLYFGIASALFVLRIPSIDIISADYFKSIESICWISGVFGFGYQYLNRPSKWLSYLSEAVYPVYIIHMFVMFGVSTLILPLEISPVLQFLGVTGLTLVGCFLIHEFILRRIYWLRPLFGMKIKPKTLKIKEHNQA